jgi:hypothetical protein
VILALLEVIRVFVTGFVKGLRENKTGVFTGNEFDVCEVFVVSIRHKNQGSTVNKIYYFTIVSIT